MKKIEKQVTISVRCENNARKFSAKQPEKVKRGIGCRRYRVI